MSTLPNASPAHSRVVDAVHRRADRGSASRPAAPTTAAPATGSRAAFNAQVRAQFPWMNAALVRVFVDEWLRTDSPEQAMWAVRSSDRYKTLFPGNIRRDGTLRHSEMEYLSIREGMERTLAGYSINPRLFADNVVRAIEGEVSVAEFGARVNMMWERVQQNIPAVRAEYGRFFGIDAASDAALFAAVLDPKIGRDVLERRIALAEVAGEASLRGWQRSQARTRTLLNAGLDQRAAAQLYGAAQTAVPLYQGFAQRFNDRAGFGVQQFEDAVALSDGGQQSRMRRLRASEESLFTSTGAMFEGDRDGGLAGLRPR